MKVTLVFAPERQAELSGMSKKIVDYLKKRKHVVTQGVLRKGFFGRAKKIDLGKFYQSIWKKIKLSDAVITELSSPSTEVGYLMADALREKKPVLILVNKKAKIAYEPSLGWRNSRFLMIKTYEESKVESLLDEFIAFASAKIDTKFILIITPEIDAYLRWKASEEGVRKAEVVRRAVEAYMRDDEKYQKS